MRHIVVAMACTLAMVGLIGCNTVAGFGKDVEKTGEKVGQGSTKVGQSIEKVGEKIQEKANR